MHRYTVQDTFPPNGQKHNRRGAGEDLLEGAQVIIIRVSTYIVHAYKQACSPAGVHLSCVLYERHADEHPVVEELSWERAMFRHAAVWDLWNTWKS